MIEAQSVTVEYPGGVYALREASLRVTKGEFLFLVGPTGSGKSTLLKLIYREILPSSGRIVVGGRDITDLEPRQVPYLRRHLGIVFQDFGLLPQKTVWENVAFALQVISAPRHKTIREVPLALDMVGLTHRDCAMPHELSGGEQQRVSIARAIVNNPAILLADEPTGNLDPETSWEIVQLLNKINIKGTTVVIATHDKYIVDRMKKRVVRIDQGRIVRDERRSAYEDETAELGVLSAGDVYQYSS